MRHRLAALPLAIALVVLSLPLGTAARAAPDGVRVVEAWPGTSFTNPVGVVHAGDGTGTLYVLEQAGIVKAVPKGAAAPTVFLDIRSKVFSKQQGGVLGLAFHPEYASNGRLFVTYVQETGRSPDGFEIVLAELGAPGGRCDVGSERVLLRIPKSTAYHNAGCLAFGPDGMLYMSTGDNRIQKEAVQTAQNPASLLGKILRLDVNRATAPLAYGIPADNPWAGAGAGVRPEIWAYGFRNPWRFSFDEAGTLWTCEPGTKGECKEWVMRVQRGGNHGWPFFEGTRPLEPLPASMQGTSFVKPAYEYARTGGAGTTAAIGGYVYRGRQVPGLQGHYVFGDYGLGVVMALTMESGRVTAARVIAQVPNLSSLGEDADGELYACAHEAGKVYKLVP